MQYEELPSNSKMPRTPTPETERKRAEKVTTGRVKTKRPGAMRLLKENFTGDDSQTILEFVMVDVVVPAVKGLITDAVNETVQRFMWGNSAPRTPRPSGSVMKIGGMSTNYNYNKASTSGASVGRVMTPQGRSMHDFREIVLDDRSEALDVIDRLNELIENYGDATVGDLYDFVGVESVFTDRKWGWMDLRGAKVERVRDGFLIDLPRPNELR